MNANRLRTLATIPTIFIASGLLATEADAVTADFAILVASHEAGLTLDQFVVITQELERHAVGTGAGDPFDDT